MASPKATTAPKRKTAAAPPKDERQLPPWMDLTVDETANCARLVRMMRHPEADLAKYLVLWILEADTKNGTYEYLTLKKLENIFSEFKNFYNCADHVAESFAKECTAIRSHSAARWAFDDEENKTTGSWNTYGLDRLVANTRRAEELAKAGQEAR